MQETILLSVENLPNDVEAAFYALSAFAPKPAQFSHAAARAVTGADDPLQIDAAGGVACKSRVRIPVREDEHAGLERWDDAIEQPISEVGGVQQAERHRR